MQLRASAVLAGTLLVASSPAYAVVPRPVGPRPAAETLTAMPAAAIRKPLRAQAQLRWAQVPSAAWARFTAAVGGRWRAAYDQATGVPARIWGSGVAVPGANAAADVAERFARQLLADHLALLAPGASITDFELVSNHSDGAIRSIGFAQRKGGLRVVGGQVSFRFKRDRLVAIGSEALPDVKVSIPRARLSRAAVHSRATTALRHELALPAAPVTEPGDEVVLPLIGDDAVLGYRVARPITIDGGADGRYLAYADVATGGVLAVRQLNTYATGTVLYRSVDRYPGRGRLDLPAPRARVQVDGAAQTTAADGQVSWGSDVAATVTTAVVGDLVRVVNNATAVAPLATADLPLAPGGLAVWDASVEPLDDAQVNVFLSTNIVKDFVQRNLAPDMPLLGEQIIANVNIDQQCNAFFDGRTINFFQSSSMCENTGLLQDVVFHEFGHALHVGQIIEGVGAFDGAMSEGAADFLAALITNDPGMGRGFFFNAEPLRHLDPPNMEYVWPTDIREIHHTGMIFGGAMWDLRQALIAQHGELEGNRIVNKLYIGTLRRARDIPTSLFEALVEDDDDGDLDNGTPNECLIRAAFGRHGVRTATGTIFAPGSLAQKSLSTLVRLELGGLSSRCTSDEIDSVKIEWRPSGNKVAPVAGSAVANHAGGGTYWVQLPLAVDGKVLYRAKVKFRDGSVLTLADNLADPYYEIYQGPTVPLYCTSFEDGDPFAEGWTTGIDGEGESPWAWGEPMGGATDPHVAFSGTHFMALGLGGDYKPGLRSWVKMPPIDVGRWTDVHLQYRRWLAVEDSHFDQARVTVNDTKAWINFTADLGDSSATHHIDREWRFHDVPLSGYAPGRVFTVGWDLTSDEGLHLGGWHIDDVCLVANINSVCGDGVKSPTEGCDDGGANADRPDTCRSYCLRPACGDSIVDSGEECDHGPSGDNTCSASCETVEPPTLGGCCSASGGGASGSLALGAVIGGLLLRRRRYSARPRR